MPGIETKSQRSFKVVHLRCHALAASIKTRLFPISQLSGNSPRQGQLISCCTLFSFRSAAFVTAPFNPLTSQPSLSPIIESFTLNVLPFYLFLFPHISPPVPSLVSLPFPPPFHRPFHSPTLFASYYHDHDPCLQQNHLVHTTV